MDQYTILSLKECFSDCSSTAHNRSTSCLFHTNERYAQSTNDIIVKSVRNVATLLLFYCLYFNTGTLLI